MNQITTALAGLEIGEATFRGGLTVFPLFSREISDLDYLLLGKGLRENRVTVREVSMGGSVPELEVENRAARPVLIVDGEELVGAKQNRVANLTLMLPAGKTTIIPVSCVEQGRWSYDSPRFQVTNRLHFASGRAERYASVQQSMRNEGTRRSDQSRVWRSIHNKAVAMSASSETGAMSEIFERHAKALDDYVREVEAAPDQLGAIFAVAGGNCGLDLFDRHATLAAFLPRLVRSYGVDALERRAERDGAAPASAARDFLDRLRAGSFDDHPAVGLGRDVGIVSERAIGGALVVDETAVHLTGFSNPRTGRGDRTRGSVHASQRRDALRQRCDALRQRRDALRRRHAS